MTNETNKPTDQVWKLYSWTKPGALVLTKTIMTKYKTTVLGKPTQLPNTMWCITFLNPFMQFSPEEIEQFEKQYS